MFIFCNAKQAVETKGLKWRGKYERNAFGVCVCAVRIHEAGDLRYAWRGLTGMLRERPTRLGAPPLAMRTPPNDDGDPALEGLVTAERGALAIPIPVPMPVILGALFAATDGRTTARAGDALDNPAEPVWVG
eukprot:Opistho-2@2660